MTRVIYNFHLCDGLPVEFFQGVRRKVLEDIHHWMGERKTDLFTLLKKSSSRSRLEKISEN